MWVFQTKIIALPPEDRWKPIPIIFEQQEFALRIIEQELLSGRLRKQFVSILDLMLSKGQAFENISIWMGHSTLERTWKSYKRRRKFHLVGF